MGTDWRRRTKTLTMYLRLVTLLSLLASLASGEDVSFTYNGFQTAANLSLDGLAQFTPNGLLILTNRTKQETGHAFYSHPIRFKNSSNAPAFSFSTTFVFAIHPQYPTLSGHGIAFVIAPTRGLPGALPSQHLGLFSDANNGNSTNHIYDQPKVSLNWSQRFRVLKGVASGLSYLHGEWEQVVVHRDVKASNVLLDGELNGRLGDFGLARLYDHGTDPQTTHVVGTLGYLAPEHTRTGKATTRTDVYAFGAFLLEIAC